MAVGGFPLHGPRAAPVRPPAIGLVVLAAAAGALFVGVHSVWVLGSAGFALFSLGRAFERTEAPPSGPDFTASLVKEIERARRRRNSLAVVRIQGLSAVEAEQLVKPSVRITDDYFEESGVLFVIMPEERRSGALVWLERLGLPVHDGISVGVAEFPNDGLTVGSMLEKLAQDHSTHDQDGSPPASRGGPTATLTRPLNGHPTGSRSRREPRYERAKRAIDLVLCVAIFPIVAPLMGLVALAVALDSPGPAMFTQMRTGRHGHRFKLYKFRTMVENAEELKASLAHLNVLSPPDFKIPDDPRVTRVGRFLRKTSLDELPQLLNILKGDMSFVGPRPTSFSADTYDLWHTTRLEVRPGLTGLWQIRARGDVDFDERLRLDVEYIRTRSLLTDLRIMAATFTSVAKGSGQ